MVFTPIQPTDYFSYGDIPIDRDQLTDLKASTATGNYQSDRIVYPTNIINKGNEIDRIQITMRLSELELIPWLNYFNDAPTNLQQDLKLGIWSSLNYAIESISVKYLEFVPLGNDDFLIMYETTVNFIRSL